MAFKEKGYRLPFLLSHSHYSLEFRQSDEPPWTLQMRTKVYRWQNNQIKKIDSLMTMHIMSET